MVRRTHIIVSGRVQGVFFRAATRDTARRLRLKGWVRNRPDGTVEIVAEGPDEDLRNLLAWCRHGPPGAAVSDVTADSAAASGEFSGFDVVY